MAGRSRVSVFDVTPEQLLVRGFGQRGREVDSLRGLTGGVTATHLRSAVLIDSAFAAVIEGLEDSNARVRWWCVQVLDHVPGCRACKPEW
jgi:hypothetical protein